MMPTGPACLGDCPDHDRPCEQSPGHDGVHDCPQCLSYLGRQRAAMIADRIATHRALHASGFVTTPDED
jgi:hypothetical protein